MLVARFDYALRVLKNALSSLHGHQKFLSDYLDVLQKQLARTEAMRSRFEDSDVAQLQLENNRLDLLRQAAMSALANSESQQRSILAALLGFQG